MSALNARTDELIEEEVAKQQRLSATGEWDNGLVISLVADKLSQDANAALRVDHVARRVKVRDTRQTMLARSRMQADLPGGFAPPQGDFRLGQNRRIEKARAIATHWLTRLRFESLNISAAQSSHQDTLAEYTAYAPYFARAMDIDTDAAWAQFQRDQGNDPDDLRGGNDDDDDSPNDDRDTDA